MKTVYKTIVAALFAVSAGTGLAQDADIDSGHGHGQRHDRSGQRSMPGMPSVHRLVRALHHLDLSDEQKDSIHSIMQQLKTDVRPIMEEMKTGHMQMKELVKADEYDAKAVAELAEKEGDLAAERIVITSAALSEVVDNLTVEQRAELETMAENRKGHRSEKRKHRPSQG